MAQSLAYLYHSNNRSTANGVAQHLTELLSDCCLKGTFHLHSCYIGNSTTHQCLFTSSDSVGVYLKHTYGIPWIHYSFHRCGTFDCASAALPTSFCKTSRDKLFLPPINTFHMLQLLKTSWNCLQLLKWLFLLHVNPREPAQEKGGGVLTRWDSYIGRYFSWAWTLDAWIVFPFSLED